MGIVHAKADEPLKGASLDWSTSLTSLFDECVRARAVLLSGAPGLIVENKGGSTMAISGEPMSWANWLIITSEIADASVVDAFIQKVRPLGVPSTIVCKKELSFQIEPTVEGAGYIRTADSALMTLEAKSDFPQEKGCRLRKLTDASMNDALAEIIGQATISPKEAIKRLVDPGVLAAKNVEVFVALRDGLPVATATTAIGDTTVGIWRMVTAPEYQRQGIGQALLAQLINLYQERNLRRFYLVANSIGRRLYEKLGFVSVTDLAQWVL
jgi:GNAT superfamily N-acetyltransferase